VPASFLEGGGEAGGEPDLFISTPAAKNRLAALPKHRGRGTSPGGGGCLVLPLTFLHGDGLGSAEIAPLQWGRKVQ
jgi:hypothetical protein